MGATTFSVVSEGATADEAFRSAGESARYEYGHGGYTGSIAEKSSFVMIRDSAAEVLAKYRADLSDAMVAELETGKPIAIASALLDGDDHRISDKWGPAGCIQLGPKKFLFFGWASE